MAELVTAFRALGDPVRQRMLALLEAAGERCVSDIAGHFELSQPAISHHLRILRDARLVTARRRGKEILYAINAAELTRCCGTFFARFACCQPLLAEGKAKGKRQKAKVRNQEPGTRN
jgi:DNA-binding transcriptional ArsR family regulator